MHVGVFFNAGVGGGVAILFTLSEFGVFFMTIPFVGYGLRRTGFAVDT